MELLTVSLYSLFHFVFHCFTKLLSPFLKSFTQINTFIQISSLITTSKISRMLKESYEPEQFDGKSINNGIFADFAVHFRALRELRTMNEQVHHYLYLLPMYL